MIQSYYAGVPMQGIDSMGTHHADHALTFLSGEAEVIN